MTILAIILIVVFWKEIVTAVYGFFGLIIAFICGTFSGISNLLDSNHKH